MKKIAYSALALALTAPYMAFAQPRVDSIQDAGGFLIGLLLVPLFERREGAA